MRKEDAVGERSLIMILSLMSRPVVGANPGMLELLESSLEHPRGGYNIIAALPLPEAFSEGQKRDAAYFRWERCGRPWRSSQQDRDTEYEVAVEKLQEQYPKGLALTYVSGRIVRILAIIIPSMTGCQDSHAITRSLLDGVSAFTKRMGADRIVCQCAFQCEMQDILYEKGFRSLSGGGNYERSV
ncbi:hypothetical protein A3J91_05600 [Candidatus Peribacteria bacterium RIFOXYC2_FULL_58_10]|nr:MAG: hypothetical protein A3J91_05600 [Candidatus Peribacteria bacterium RIFOXYC2_FULL_58_10]OGJ84816.1 MAG: hypothetical protein A2529_00640 [Candidatus Peribacteria bacterium RIFOXYD2_FULL_58_15]HAS34355.1 hypothetical protein [Candidatus Peribacteria bacterium]